MAFGDKKYCDICGEKIKMLGNRKLDDGNMCKTCANKLSPFFSERRRSTIADINEQLAYREANKAAVAAFHTTRTLGRGTKVLLDEDAGKFIVSSARKLEDENPDVLDFSQVTGCILDVNESRREIKKKDADGKEVSYNPPRYVYSYDFNMTIHVNAPWFDEIKFRLNNSTINVEPPASGGGLLGIVINQNTGDVIGRQSVDYRECEELATEIREALTKVRENVRSAVDAANVPKQAKTCPSCRATTVPDAQGRCEFCRGVVE